MPPADSPAELEELREQVIRLLRVEADLFKRNEQLEAQTRIYRSLSDLAQQFHGRLDERDIAAVVVHFALYVLNLERAVVGLYDGEQVRVVAHDGYYDEASAEAIAGLAFALDHPLFEAVGTGERERLRSLAEPVGERDELGRIFELDEYAWLPLRDGLDVVTGYLVVGNTARKALHHGRIIADDPVVLALENLVDLTLAALRSARLDAALRAERDLLEARVEQRTHEREQLWSEIVRAQEQRLEELSTPILPIAQQVLVMPLIGTMDAQRSAALREAALEGAASRRAKFVILDVTGVKAMDSSFARMLISTETSLCMLGVRTVISGIRPEMAQAMIDLDVQLDSLVTRGTLQSAIAHALRQAADEL